MGLPNQPITLSVDDLAELNRKLSHLRHDINNNLSLMVAAVELIRHKPQMAERMLVTLSEQPPRMSACLNKFSLEFEQALGITRP
jgi:cob(I)alamin adenosyltransferase